MRASILLLFFLVNTAIAQNLVPNPSFEEYYQLPDGIDQWDRCKDWYSTRAKNAHHNPDYYHLYGSGESQPNNIPYAYCFPDIDGKAMMGFTSKDYHNYDSVPPHFEYIYARLKSPLVPGARYKVSFWYSRGISDIIAEDFGYFGLEFMENEPKQDRFYDLRTQYSHPHSTYNSSERSLGKWVQVEFEFAPTTTYQYLVLGQFGWVIDKCKEACFDYYFVDQVEVYYIDGPQVKITGKQKICKGDSITLKGKNTHDYEWAALSNPSVVISTDPELKVSPEKDAAYILKGSTGVDTHYVEVVDISKTVRLPKDTTICLEDSFRIGRENSSTATYLWKPNGETTPTISVTQPGKYQVTAELDGCSIESDLMEVIDVSQKLNLPDSVFLCKDSSVILSNASLIDANYYWSPIDATTPQIKVERSGVYTLQIEKLGCTALDTSYVIRTPSISVQLGENHTICEEDEETLTLHAGKGFKYYAWHPTSDSTEFLVVDKVDSYYVVVKDLYGCSGGDGTKIQSHCFQPSSIFFPNTFTPNGDGINETFEIKGHKIKEYEVRIYNRWGECVFESTEIMKAWDGTFKGKMCNGAYFYTCSVMGPDHRNVLRRKFFSGTVNVIR